MGLVVTTDEKEIKIYRKDRQTQAGGTFATYSIKIASKKKDGNWVNGFIDVAFKKDVEVVDKSVIKINKAFFTANEYNGKSYVKLMITDFDVVEEGEAPQPPADIPTEDFINIPDGELDELVPFA